MSALKVQSKSPTSSGSIVNNPLLPNNMACHTGVCEKKPLAQAHKGEIGSPPGAQGMLPTNPQDWGKSLQNYPLRGFGGKLACPKASWVPYKPFGSRETQCSQTWNHFQSKIMFFGVPLSLKTSPPPSLEPDSGSWTRMWVRGAKCGPQV